MTAPALMDGAVREQLILDHMHQVRSVARQIHERVPQNITLDDLISAGVLGLIAAIDNYDPSQQAKLSTYAEFRIRGAILDSLRGMDWAPRLRRKKAKAIDDAIATLAQRLHGSPTEEEIAADLKITLDEYHAWLIDIQGVNLGSIDYRPPRSPELQVANMLQGPVEEQPLSIIERAEMARILTQAINDVPELERLVLSLYFQKEMAPHEIAEIMNIRPARVSQLKAQGLARLRARLTQTFTTKTSKHDA